jgi:hypothetical protein
MRSLFTSVSIVPGELSRDEILVIAGDLASFEGIPLSHAESRRAQSMSSVEARLRFTAARRILRSVISSWIGVSPLDLEIVPDENGKPRLEPSGDVHFSISHTSDYIAVAFSRSAVGLDLERMRQVDAMAWHRASFPRRRPWLFGNQGRSTSSSNSGPAGRPPSRPTGGDCQI